MKSKERIIAALNCQIPDRVPIFEHLFSPKLQEKLIGYKTILYEGEAIVKLANELGIDGVPIPIGGFCGFEDSASIGNTYTDEWGITYKKKGWPVMTQIETPIKNRKDWNNYKLPNPKSPYRLKRIKDAILANNKDIAIVADFLGPVTMVYWYLMNIYTMYITIFEDPELIIEMVGAYKDWVLKVASEVAKIEAIAAFKISDDWGDSKGLLLSPEHLRQFFFNSFSEIVKGLKKLGKPVILHNDGNIWEIFNDIVNTGINGYHPIERDASMDLKIIKSRYKNRLCPIGNINNKSTMVNGTVDDVIRETIECLEIGSPGGGYIISTDHSIHDDIPVENVFAFIDTVKRFGKYLIDI